MSAIRGEAMRRVRSLLAVLVVSGFAVMMAPTAAAAASVQNGDFETGDFTGWTVVTQPGSAGSWFVYTGTTGPLSGFPIPAPAEGAFAAISDQTFPSSQVLYQDIALEPGFTHMLTFTLYYQNAAQIFVPQTTLDVNADPNQQYRVDIMDPAAPPDSVAAADVLAQVFRTEEGDPPTLGPTAVTFDLTPFAGTTVRVRFAEVDTIGNFNAASTTYASRASLLRLSPRTTARTTAGAT